MLSITWKKTFSRWIHEDVLMKTLFLNSPSTMRERERGKTSTGKFLILPEWRIVLERDLIWGPRFEYICSLFLLRSPDIKDKHDEHGEGRKRFFSRLTRKLWWMLRASGVHSKWRKTTALNYPEMFILISRILSRCCELLAFSPTW